MTDTDTKLCQRIAELEGVTCPMCGGTRRSTGRWSTSCRMCKGTGYPLYLTDATETVRMLAALIEYYDESVAFSSNSMAGLDLTCERFKNPHAVFQMEEVDAPIPVTTENVMRDIAEAYKAMLEEKAK